MTVQDRLALNFDTERFGDANKLSAGAQNTMTLIANTTPSMAQWQKDDLDAGPIVRSNYFQNRTTIYITGMLDSTANIANNAYLANNFILSDEANTLILELDAFQSHTDNISGLTVVQTGDVPSYDSASSFGQLNMMTVTKVDGLPANTDPILGSFTSLFIQDILEANNTQLQIYSEEFANSIIEIIEPESGNTTYSSNLSNTEIANIESYIISTKDVLNTRRNADWTFFRNTIQVAQDNGFLQQFTTMGGTNSFLVNNVVGTDSLKEKIASANNSNT
jgi:hypothetical protein